MYELQMYVVLFIYIYYVFIGGMYLCMYVIHVRTYVCIMYVCTNLYIYVYMYVLRTYVCTYVRGSTDKSLVWPTSRCRRTESIVSLERGACSGAELKVFSCYRG